MNGYSFIKPLIYCLAPETAHHLAIRALASGLVPAAANRDYSVLHTSLWGRHITNPIGLAAGFDKNAECIAALLRQGFGFVEVGTVTPQLQAGNPKPRLFRLEEDEAIINRMGFNNNGMEAFARRLAQADRSRQGLIGANIGKNKTTEDALADYVTLLHRIYGLSDYIAVNISSPNTPGLRALQNKAALDGLVSRLLAERRPLAEQHGVMIPLLVKIAPDLTEQDKHDIAEVALQHQLDGLIISNTTLSRDDLRSRYRQETGGLSGKPLFNASTALLREMYQLTEGKIPLIGVGGICTAEDAYAKIRAGASLVQIYSALIYQGFSMVERLKAELANLLERDGVKQVSEAVGQG